MGNDTSSPRQMERTLFNMKLTSKQLISESKKFESKAKAEEKKMLAAMKKNDKEMVKIYATNVIRDKNQAINFMRLSSRIDAVASRVETAVRMNALTKQLGQVVHGMDSVLATMDAEKITSMMDKFERQFDNLDVRSGVMESAIESSTSSAIPEEEVQALIKMVADKNAAELGDAFDAVGVGSGAGPVRAAAAAPRVAEAVAPPPDGSDLPPLPPSTRPGGGGAGGAPGGGAGDSGGDSSAALHARFAALRK